MSDELLTVKEIAAELRVVGQTVRNWIDRGELEAVRVGSRRVRVRRSELARFLEARSPRPEPPPVEVDEGSITAWATFGAALAEAASVLETPAQLADALTRLDAADTLADTLRSQQS